MATMDLSANEQTINADNSASNYTNRRPLNNLQHAVRTNKHANAKSTNLISNKLAKTSSQSPPAFTKKNRMPNVNSLGGIPQIRYGMPGMARAT